MTVEPHKIYPIGMLEDGDIYCVEVCARGYANWFKLYAEFDLFDELAPPTLPDEKLQDLLGLRYKTPEDVYLQEEWS